MNKRNIFKINLLALFLLASCTTPTTTPVTSPIPNPTVIPSANSSVNPTPSQSSEPSSSVNPSPVSTPSAGGTINTGTTLSIPSNLLKLSYYDYFSAELKWPQVTGAKSYKIYQDGNVIADNLNSSIYYVKNLRPNTDYSFDIVAVNDAGESNKSSIKMRTFIPSSNTSYNYNNNNDVPVLGPRDRSINGVIFVDLSSTNGANNGTTWNNAYTNLQDALSRNDLNGKQIWIAKGTYYPSAPIMLTALANGRDASFIIPGGLKVYGGFAGTELSTDTRTGGNTVTLSGDLNKNDDASDTNTHEDNSYHILSMLNQTTVSSLDNITISNGNANSNNNEGYNGGAIYIKSSPLNLNRVILSNNRADDDGGAVYADGTGYLNITDSIFKNNESEDDDGGAIYVSVDGNFTIKRSIFENNKAKNDDGAAIYRSGSGNTNIIDSKFNNNFAEEDGGAINISSGASGEVSIVNSQFNNNSAEDDGGAISNKGQCKFIVNNSTFTGNLSDSNGGAIYLTDGTPLSISGSKFTSNISQDNGGAIYLGSGPLTLDLMSSIFSMNSATNNGNSIYVSYDSTLNQGTGTDANTINSNDIYQATTP